MYALTGRDDRPGVKRHQLLRESIVARDFLHNILAYDHLSSISTTFSTISTDTYRTLRFRYVNLGTTLYIDSRESDTTTYTLLTAINMGSSRRRRAIRSRINSRHSNKQTRNHYSKH